MNLTRIPIAKSLNKAYLKQSLKREQIKLFKDNLSSLLRKINEKESEEHLKNLVADFLKDTWFSPAVPQLEAEIDRLVYTLYGLTDEEIAVVERQPS